jgi:3-phosphoshikimate 1-carboxyvinyltransferase
MSQLKIFSPNSLDIKGTIVLNGSKSICNRALIIRSLCEEDFEIKNLSNAVDTVSLDRLLKSNDNVLDAGAAGTTYRFLTAYLATQSDREVVLTGSQRMKERPIKILVEALRNLGADISYTENEGYPPLKIKGAKLLGGKLSIPANTSSQYISALLMVAPKLSNGLELHLKGEIVSRPYIQMTLDLMQYFGVENKWEGNIIKIHHQNYISKPFYAEADWSAASYYYSIAALSNSAEISLVGLQEMSLQGDAVVAQIFKQLGVYTTYFGESIVLKKEAGFVLPKTITYDFIECPDLAQTVVAVCGALGIDGLFSGLSTLKIKETDRIAALSIELAKLNISFKDLQEGEATLGGSVSNRKEVSIATYEDHRMAMAFAPLSILTKSMIIEEPEVVNKSYPKFWEDLKKLGFTVVMSNQ